MEPPASVALRHVSGGTRGAFSGAGSPAQLTMPQSTCRPWCVRMSSIKRRNKAIGLVEAVNRSDGRGRCRYDRRLPRAASTIFIQYFISTSYEHLRHTKRRYGGAASVVLRRLASAQWRVRSDRGAVRKVRRRHPAELCRGIHLSQSLVRRAPRFACYGP
eukprot:5232017-Pleurochrysis_carterae.AAC.2